MLRLYGRPASCIIYYRHVFDLTTHNIARYGTCVSDYFVRPTKTVLQLYCRCASGLIVRKMSNIHRLSECEQNGGAVKESGATKSSFQPIRLNGYMKGDDNDVTVGQSLIELAVRYLEGGGVIAVPTDTIYGICCLVQNSEAVNRIYDIKGRSHEKPLAISVADIPNVYRWGRVVQSDALLRDLLPGPVTVVLERTPELNPTLNPGTSLVGIRVPDCGFVREVCRACSGPIALTSANISNQQSSLCVEEFSDLWGRLDAVFDGGKIESSSKSGSTVVDLSSPGSYTIVRSGSALESTVEKLRKHGLTEHRAT